MEDSTILRISGLRLVSVTGNVIVDNVDLQLQRGEVLGLIGESGAGKSTIGLSSMCYARAGLHIAGGEVVLDGVNIRALDAEGRRQVRGKRIAYIAQSAAAAFNPAHSLMDQVCEAPVLHKLMTRPQAEAWARELFVALDLPDAQNFGSRHPHQVSGGQLQRAMAAMAMSCRPDVLVLDEPTTALDVTTQIEVLILLKSLIRQYGTAALYITHDLAVVAQVADRIKVLRHGKEVEEGLTQQILHEARQDYTARLVAVRGAAASERAVGATVQPETVLKVQDCHAYYGDFHVVRGVSLDVQRGETVAVVGESGSGKSTLARIITGLLPPRSGQILFQDKALPAMLKQRSKELKRTIQLVYQIPDVAINPRQTLREIIGRPVEFYFDVGRAEVNARAKELMTLVELPQDYLERRPGQLSGGQKQRVCIARALAAPVPELPKTAAPDAEEKLPLIGKGPAMQEIYRTIARLTTADLTVMINGESGTGKELVARALHDYGRRRAGPFVPINMAAIPRELIESELFGHERGAFTGATNRNQGRFEQAHGGTLFLDEIGDMPPEAQTRLLRVLQEGEFTTVGGRAPIRANVRIIAATHRDLRAAIRQGQFREDLFYRLNVVPIRLPPLRERVEDIQDLARHFLDRARAEGLPAKSLDMAATAALRAHRWPGNVRELENVMRRLAALWPDEVITAEAVRPELAEAERHAEDGMEAAPHISSGVAAPSGAPEPLSRAIERHIKQFLANHREGAGANDIYDRVLAEVERPLIQMTLSATRGNQIKAAAMLGLNRNTLRKKIRDLEIPVLRGIS
jgi:nitrogen regulation protein NR(I)